MSHYNYLPVHVWDSDRAVVCAAARAIKRSCRRDPRLRAARKRFYREMLAAHRAHQRLVTRFRL